MCEESFLLHILIFTRQEKSHRLIFILINCMFRWRWLNETDKPFIFLCVVLDLSLIMGLKLNVFKSVRRSSALWQFLSCISYYLLYLIWNTFYYFVFLCLFSDNIKKTHNFCFLKIFNGFSTLRATSFVEFEYKIHSVRKCLMGNFVF